MATNKASLDNVLRAILSVNNEEQSAFYPPRIYTDQRNAVESILLSSLIKSYPANQEIIDQIEPFVVTAPLTVTNGFFTLPGNYRNLLGSPMCFANPQSTGECGQDSGEITAQMFQTRVLKSGCLLNPIVIVPQSEFAFRTQSTYDFPTWENPIGMFTGKRQIKVCPYDITRVIVMYAMQETPVNYGYIMQPDDTYIYDAATTIETQFGSNAFMPIFNGMMALYSAYSKDRELQNWAQILQKEGIL